MSECRQRFDEAILRICSYTSLDNRTHREYIPNVWLLPREMHTLEKIYYYPGINTTKLAQLTGIPKGTISKMTRDFSMRELIECYREKENLKEIYYRVTEKGLRVVEAHADFHRIVGKKFYTYLESLPDSSKEIVLDVLDHYADYMKELYSLHVQRLEEDC